MFFKKSPKPDKKTFTNEQICAKAYRIWEKNKEQSEEENWNAAIKSLEKERKWRFLISFWRWTGLGEKKGWDIIIQLLSSVSIPFLLWWGTQYFSQQNSQQQQEVAEQKQKDELLKIYINDMKGFLLDEKHPLKDLSKNDESKSIARAITLITLTQLNSEEDGQRKQKGMYNQRKGLIMRFLFESGLIQPECKHTIIGADFSFAYLEWFDEWFDIQKFKSSLIQPECKVAIIPPTEADFSFADLEWFVAKKVDFSEVVFQQANLKRVTLRGSTLSSAQLTGTNLSNADLGTTDFSDAKLIDADLSNANLEGTNLKDTHLNGANLNGAKNLTNPQIKSACYWEKAIFTEADWNSNLSSWTIKDKIANQKRIDEIKQDKTSDPKEPPDCSIWK